MLTRRYPRYTGEYFTYSYALVFTNRFWTLIMSGMLMLWLRPRASRSTVIYEYSFPSISNMLSSWCQYEALRYVSFPATTLFKSFKLAPVMAMGKILGNKTCKHALLLSYCMWRFDFLLTSTLFCDFHSRSSIRLRRRTHDRCWNYHVYDFYWRPTIWVQQPRRTYKYHMDWCHVTLSVPLLW